MNKISIKEAGRYSNFLKQTMTEIIMMAKYEDKLSASMYNTVENHLIGNALPDAMDEVIKSEDKKLNRIDLEKLENIVDTLRKEKLELSKAITKAKEKIRIEIEDFGEVGLDTAVEYAKFLRVLTEDYYSVFTSAEESRSESIGKRYTFNVEGNQVPYVYDIVTETTLNFKKDDYQSKERELNILADNLSDSIDRAMSEAIVDFNPSYSYLDNLDDLLKK